MEPVNGMTVLTQVLTALWAQISDVVSTITSSPVLMIGVGIWVAGAAIGLAYRLIRG